jgi:hypothetical protein
MSHSLAAATPARDSFEPAEAQDRTESQLARPVLSIVVPTYRRTELLDRFFRHHVRMLDQIGFSYEILVIDDASPDDTQHIIKSWAETCPHIRSIRNPTNVGFRANYLSCLREAKGHFTAYVGNDDLLIGETLRKHIVRMAHDPEIVMLQAPWFLLDESSDHRINGRSYNVDSDLRFHRGEHGRCLDFILTQHVFPEWYIVRTNAIAEIAGPYDKTTYHFFSHLSNALDLGDVVFAAEPYAIVTEISRAGDTHVGNAETLFGWDEYRGGIEHLAAAARRQDPSWIQGHPDLLQRIQDFTTIRMQVALKLHTDAKNWLHAWHLKCRLDAHGASQLTVEAAAELASLAAMEACVVELVRLGHRTILVSERCFAIFREVIKAGPNVTLLCEGDTLEIEATACIAFGSPPEFKCDTVIDLTATMRRYRA